MIKFWVTYSPRKIETIDKSIQSLRDCGINDTIYIFAEPSDYQFKDTNIEIIKNQTKLWCFRNFDNMLRNIDSEYILSFQDDYIFRKGFKEELESIDLNQEFSYYNFILDYRVANYITKEGWNDVRNGWNNIWACYLLKPKQILESKFYNNHLTNYVPRRNQQIDSCIWEVWKELNKPCYLPSYSWIAHIWESLIWHTDEKLWEFFKKL